jgi:hypothetical protein
MSSKYSQLDLLSTPVALDYYTIIDESTGDVKRVTLQSTANLFNTIYPSGGGITSVFGRTGVVVAQSGDYTKAQVGLGNVLDVDTTNPANITQSLSYRFVTDTEKNTWNTKQDLLVSATNIKTINGVSVLGAGDIIVSGGATNLSTTQASTTVVVVNSDTGTDATIASATGSIAGLQSAADKTKLDAIASGATANSSDATLLNRDNHAGTQLASTISDFNTAADARVVAGITGKQDLDADLTAIAGLVPTNDDVIQRKAGSWINRTIAQLKADFGLTKSDVGLSNVDNTSDTNKPISTATQTALNNKQDLDSDLTAIAAIAPINDDIIQRKAGTWTNRTPAQVKTDLVLTKTDVGLANVDNTSDATKNSAAAALTNKTISGASNTLSNIAESSVTNLVSDLAGKQETLVSTVNIKSVNNQSLLGAGDITISGGSTLTGEWKFDTSVTMADPGTGDVRCNNAVAASVTEIAISQTTNTAIDATNYLGALNIGDSFYIQDENDSTRFGRYNLSAVPIDNGTWWTIAVTYVKSGSGGLPLNNQICKLTFGLTGATGGGGVTDGDKGDITVSASGATWTLDSVVNLSLGTPTATTYPVSNSKGTGFSIPSATTAEAGLFQATDKTKLDGIATGATKTNFLTQAVDFGASFTDKAQTTVAATWVTPTSRITPQVLTPTGSDPDEMYLLNIRPVISNIVNGVGFTLTLYSEPEAKGSYDVMIIGA